MIVCMIWWLHVVELVFLMIFICHTSDLEFNNMLKSGFNFRISKLGFITRMNVFNWNLGVFDSGVINCWFIVGCVPYEICNRLIYSSLTEDAWIVGSCDFKSPDVRRKPAMILANFRPEQGWLEWFVCMDMFLVICSLILEVMVVGGCRRWVLRQPPTFPATRTAKLQFGPCTFENDEVWFARFPDFAKIGFLF